MIESIPVTMFRGLRFTTPKEHTTLDKVLEQISSDKWKDRVLKCHANLKSKDWLPAFTPTGTFSHRSLKGLDSYNGIICLDLDNTADQFGVSPEELKETCKELSWIHAAFITPSGKGLKVIVKTNASRETYKVTEELVADMFFIATDVARDNHCKDIARIQFISYDPALYYNPDSDIIEHAEIELEIFSEPK